MMISQYSTRYTIVLDTNVVSGAMKPAPDPAVRTLAELLFGIGALSHGRRKKALAETLDSVPVEMLRRL